MGAPKGNQNRLTGLRMKQAIKKALERKWAENGRPKSRADAQKALEEIWYQVIDKAYVGDQWAVDTLLDRLIGKPKQEIEQTGIKTITGIEMKFVVPEAIHTKPENLIEGEVIVDMDKEKPTYI